MKSQLVMLWAALVLISCGGSENLQEISPALDGVWSVEGTVSASPFVNGNAPFPGAKLLVIETKNGITSMTPVCLDGYRTADQLHGSGNGPVVWPTPHADVRQMECYPVPLGNCPAVTFTVTIVTVELKQDRSISILIGGTADGCGIDDGTVSVFLTGRQ